MHPILFVLEIGASQRPVASYGVMLALGMVLGGILAVRAAQRAGIDGSDALAAVAIVSGSGLFGASALQLVVETARGVPLTDALQRGGLTFYGAPIAGTLALVFAARWLRIPLGRFCDVVVPAVPVVHAMGRIGCFLAGCCYGRASDRPWSVSFTHPLAPAAVEPIHRHPVQLYEAGLLLLIALVFVVRPPARVGAGRRAVAYAAAYACVRLFTEMFRGDEDRGFVVGPVSTSQAISLVVLALSSVHLARTK